MAFNLVRLVEIPILLNQEIAFCRNQSLGIAAMHLEILMAYFSLLFVTKISLLKYVNTPGLKCCGTESIFICASVICFKAFLFIYFTEFVCPILVADNDICDACIDMSAISSS